MTELAIPTAFTLNIGIASLLTLLVLKFEQLHFTVCLYVFKLQDELQRVYTVIIRHVLWRLIWVYPVGSHFMSMYNDKKGSYSHVNMDKL